MQERLSGYLQDQYGAIYQESSMSPTNRSAVLALCVQGYAEQAVQVWLQLSYKDRFQSTAAWGYQTGSIVHCNFSLGPGPGLFRTTCSSARLKGVLKFSSKCGLTSYYLKQNKKKKNIF